MAAEQIPAYITPEEYLQAEEASSCRNEYRDGCIVAMAGATPEHVRIRIDTLLALGPQLRHGNCELLDNDLRVSVPNCNSYFYPDISVACEGSQFQTIQGLRSLLNPALIIEVLSSSTELDDRGAKFLCYQTLPLLQTYVLISQHVARIEVFTRQTNGSWSYDRFDGLDAIVSLPSIGCQLRLADVYARVPFPPTPNAADS